MKVLGDTDYLNHKVEAILVNIVLHGAAIFFITKARNYENTQKKIKFHVFSSGGGCFHN